MTADIYRIKSIKPGIHTLLHVSTKIEEGKGLNYNKDNIVYSLS